jgi:hypothetical protein
MFLLLSCATMTGPPQQQVDLRPAEDIFQVQRRCFAIGTLVGNDFALVVIISPSGLGPQRRALPAA